MQQITSTRAVNVTALIQIPFSCTTTAHTVHVVSGSEAGIMLWFWNKKGHRMGLLHSKALSEGSLDKTEAILSTEDVSYHHSASHHKYQVEAFSRDVLITLQAATFQQLIWIKSRSWKLLESCSIFTPGYKMFLNEGEAVTGVVWIIHSALVDAVIKCLILYLQEQIILPHSRFLFCCYMNAMFFKFWASWGNFCSHFSHKLQNQEF